MAASTPREVVVEIDGLWFRIQKLRGRRAFRGTRALQTILGHRGYLMISSPKFWEAEEDAQLAALIQLEVLTASSYDETEQAMVELLAHSSRPRGEGVCYRDTEPSAEEPAKGWIPVRSMETLDTFDQVDHLTWAALRWEMIRLCYRPTLAAGGTSAATRSAATTSTQANSHSGKTVNPRSGSQTAETPPSGISGA